MQDFKKIKTALISVFHKEGLEKITSLLIENEITIYSTGGTQDFLESLGANVIPVEKTTSYPSILGGRVKTLHPKVFGGILARRNNQEDTQQLTKYEIPEIDLVLVDLYPFQETVLAGGAHHEIIEKIDIGGISLIRAAAKNYNDVLIIPGIKQYHFLEKILKNKAESSIDQRKKMALEAFNISSVYDKAIFNYFNQDSDRRDLRYGENPHQKGVFHGKINDFFNQLNGKELSYNNLLDVDAAVCLMEEFNETTVAILKHNNACGIAARDNLLQAWKAALAADPISAFGGVIITNKQIDLSTAKEINKIFYEVLIAPDFDKNALDLLKTKKNRIILKQKKVSLPRTVIRTALNGFLEQERDLKTDLEEHLKTVTLKKPTKEQIEDLLFAAKVCKHTKSNTIVLVKNKQLYASGVGQTSRVDALKQAIEKAANFNLDLRDSVMASDAFFPFPDCVEIAAKVGVDAVIQPGGSIKDDLSINYCNDNNMSMVLTGTRHFKH